MEEFEIEDKQFGGGHPTFWMDLTPEQRVAHYNRNLPKGCTHKVNLYDWPPDLRASYSYDPYAHVSHDDVHHSVEGFKNGTCECNACVANVGIERNSPFEYHRRRRKAVS